MSKSKQLAALFAGAFTLAPLFGTSAFAETRHRDATRSDNSSARDHRGRSADQQNGRVQSEQNNRSTRADQSGRAIRGNDAYRNGSARDNQADRNDNAYRSGSVRNNRADRNDNAYRGNRGRYDNRQRQTFSGRVSRVERHGGGYNVWIGGGRFPLFIPEARFRLFPLRVGIDIRLGGYWNPAGYYDAYDYNNPYASQGDLRGVVENVDYRSGTVVVRDDVSGSFVTTVLRGNDPRLGSLRPGDWVDLNGAFSRAGVFEAYSVSDLRGGYGQPYQPY